MGKVRRSTLLALALLLLYVGGCKVSCTTANVSSLKFSKDKAGSTQTKEFAPGDTVYAIATVSNNSGKVTLKFRLFTEKVQGEQENAPVPGVDVSVDVDGDGGGVYTLAPQGGTWSPGRYRVEVVMLYNGEQKDKKEDTFTITGGTSTGGGAPPPRPAGTPGTAATPSQPGEGPSEDDTTEENANGSEEDGPDREP
ncbi:MAG TPA: hypothetical protein VN256_18245 [Pyrinomonadaceae bacterium]|nr:hypothetical protein [Pyrinomonadaceae bacterium]